MNTPRKEDVVARAWNSYPVVDLLILLYTKPEGWTTTELAKKMGTHHNTVWRMLIALQVREIVVTGKKKTDADWRPAHRPEDRWWPNPDGPFSKGFTPCSTLIIKGA